MPNTFNEKVTRFTPVLDKIYKKASLTAMLERQGVEWVGTNKIKRPQIEIDGAGDYDRSDGYVQGGVEVSYEDYELEFDRGRKFHIDVIDDDETGFALYQESAVEYVRTKEVPEVDAVRFARFADAALAEGIDEDDDPDALEVFDDAMEYLDDNEVPEETRVAFVSTAMYRGLKEEFQKTGRWDMVEVGPNGVELSRKIATLDGVPLIKVPSSRFYDVVELNDGTSTGQEAGGFAPDAGTSKALHMIMADATILEAYVKRNVSKIISPEMNQSADAWIIAYRNHHDAIVSDNKKAGIYVAKKATAVA